MSAVLRISRNQVTPLQIALVACGALVGVLLAVLAPSAELRLDVGSPGDESYISDFFPSERNERETYRWIGDQARLSLPVPGAGDYNVELELAAFDTAGRTLTVTCGERVTQLPLDAVAGNLTVPLRCSTSGERLDVQLAVEVVRYPADGRPLGLAVREVRVESREAVQQVVGRVAVAAALLGTTAGVYLALRALWPRTRVWTAIPVLLFAWAYFAFNRWDDLWAVAAGPGWALCVIGGAAALALARDDRRTAWAAALGAPAVCLVLPQATPSLVLPALWTEGDLTAAELLPWLAAAVIVAAVVLRGRSGVWLAAYAVLIGLTVCIYPLLTGSLANRWAVQIAVPHWRDVASAGGLVLLALLFGCLVLAGVAAVYGGAAGRRVVLAMSVVVIGTLALWRADIMRLNGDEPHYYVNAHSIGADRDLELLNNYQEPEYQTATISPLGNIAVERDASVDRYEAFGPSFAGQWFLIPPIDDGQSSEPSGLRPATGAPPQIELADGSRAALPALTPGMQLAIPLLNDCDVRELWLGRVDPAAATATIRVLNADGGELWNDDTALTDEPVQVALPDDAGACNVAPRTIVIESDGDVVALALDTGRGGMRAFAARVTGEAAILTGLPKDRYALPEAEAAVALYNPSERTIVAVIRTIGPSNQVLRTISVGLPPGATRVEAVPAVGVDALYVEPAAALVVGGSGTVLGGVYALNATGPLRSWELTVGANPKRDAGVWLTLVNTLPESHAAIVRDGAREQLVELCGMCAATLFLEAGERDRVVQAESVDDALIFAGALEYEERTDSLHFDLLLPLLAAPLAVNGTPTLALLVPALAGVLLALGVYALLRRVACGEPWSTLGGLAAVLVLPLSTYSVRLYTEIVACALLVWALVAWDAARERHIYLIGVVAAAAALPFLHARLTPLAVVLLFLALLRLASGSRLQQLVRSLVGQSLNGRGRGMAIAPTEPEPRSPVGATAMPRPPSQEARTTEHGHGRRAVVVVGLLAGAAVVVVLLAGEFAIGLSGRVTLSYFDVGWVTFNLLGSLLDRGTGLLPFTPWVLLALAAPRPLSPLQRAALALVIVNLLVVMLRAGGWMTWGSAGRYLLPVVPLLALLVVPGARRLWDAVAGRVAVTALAIWSAATAMLLHWLPLSGYVWRQQGYQIDAALGELLGTSYWLFPKITPRVWGAPLGTFIVLALAGCVIYLLWPPRLLRAPAVASPVPRAGHARAASATRPDATPDRPPAPGE